MFSLALPALSLIVRPSLHSRAGARRCTSGNEVRCAAADELTTDVVVVGSGLGGLSCAAMLAKYGHDVSVFEAHTIAGGCAHSFERDGYTFDSGPSLWAGCAAPSTNPLRQVLDAVGEAGWVRDGWWMYTETGEYYAQSGDEAAFKLIASRGGGGGAVAEWEKLREFLKPMATSVFAVPPVALRGDPGALLTVLPWLKAFANPLIGLRARFLQGPWSDVLDAANVHDAFLRNWFDFLAFAFSGLPSDGTIAAAMTYMLEDFYRPGAMMDYPLGGSGAGVDALVRGVEKHGGRVALARPVEELLVEDGRCVGVRLRNGTVVRARRAIVSNAPGWNTAKLLPAETRAELARGRRRRRAGRGHTGDAVVHAPAPRLPRRRAERARAREHPPHRRAVVGGARRAAADGVRLDPVAARPVARAGGRQRPPRLRPRPSRTRCGRMNRRATSTRRSRPSAPRRCGARSSASSPTSASAPR